MSEIITSIFGNYATSGALQAIIDKRKDKFKERIFPKYMEWDTPQVDLSYADVIGRSRIEAIASVIGEDAASPVRSRQGLEKLEGKIPTISHKYIMKASDYRNYITLQNQNNVSDDTKKKQIIDLIFNDVKNAADGCSARVDVMFLQALSTGKIDLTVTNNPDGVAYGSIDMMLPADNVITAAKVWTDATAKPTSDLEGVIAAAQAKGNGDFAKMLMTRPTFNKLKDSAEIQAIFKGSNRDNYSLVTLARVNDFMTSNGLPEIELQDSLFGLEQDGNITTVKAFADDVIVFVPQGQLGTVKNGLVVEGDLMQVSGHSYANVDRVKIAKWSKTEPMNEFTRGQLHAIPAITAIDAVYHLKLKTS